MKKQLLFILLTLIPMMASADAVEIDGIYYNLVENAKSAEVTKMPSDKYTGSVVIPATVTYGDVTYSVTSIGGYAFSGCSGLTSVTIGNSVTSIGRWAFYKCSGLTSVTIPNSVTSIGNSAFSYCSGLTSITIPNSVTSIGNYTFYGCNGLTSITIPNSVKSIGNSAFYACSGLTSITIGNSVTSIGNDAFCYCNALADFYCLAESVPTTKSDAFSNSNIKNATLHVPVASVNAYKASEPWNDFKSIVAQGHGDRYLSPCPQKRYNFAG